MVDDILLGNYYFNNYFILRFQGGMSNDNEKENVSIAMEKYECTPSAWFRDSFGLLGKYGTISKEQFIRASIDIGVSFMQSIILS